MAAPQPDKSDQATKASSPAPAAGAAAKAAAAKPSESKPPESKPSGAPASGAKPVRRAGSLVTRLFFSVVVLLMLLGVAGYGALLLRDTDPRIRVAADYVDEGVTQAKGLIAGLTGEAQKPAEVAAQRPTLDKAPLVSQEPASEPEKSAGAPAAETPTAKSEEAAPVEAKPVETKPVEPPPAEVKSAEAKPEEPRTAENRPAEIKPVEVAPAAPAAPVAAAPAVPAPARAESRDADGFTDRDLINALEGRLDALSDELRGLREKLDAPKNETRAAPSAEGPKPAASSDASAAAVVLAFALQRELEAGRPFAAEIAAFSRLGTDPSPAPVLADLAEKGAPTGPALREAFLPIAKKLRAHESHIESGALTEHLLQGASKLVKVRPTGEAQPESLDGKIDRLEAALAHGDFDAATRFFDSLPEEARTEAADFGARLRQRQEAAKAADELLGGAIAALGK